MPPPKLSASISSTPTYFSQFNGFKAREDTPFNDEFDRLAKHQGWIPSSQQYRRERTRAAVSSINHYYFTPAQQNPVKKEEEPDEDVYLSAIAEATEDNISVSGGDDEETVDAEVFADHCERTNSLSIYASPREEPCDTPHGHGPHGHGQISDEVEENAEDGMPILTQRAPRPETTNAYTTNLGGFQRLCQEVGQPAQGSIADCQKVIKKTFVNICDLIDARRIGTKVRVWKSLKELADYTIEEDSVFSREEARDTYAESLLQKMPPDFRSRLQERRRSSKQDTDGVQCKFKSCCGTDQEGEMIS